MLPGKLARVSHIHTHGGAGMGERPGTKLNTVVYGNKRGKGGVLVVLKYFRSSTAGAVLPE